MDALTTDQIMRASFLVLLLLGILVSMGSRRLTRSLQQLSVWGLIFLVVIAVIGLWQDIRNDVPQQATFANDGRVEVPRSFNGHYHLTLEVNGVPVEFVVDTGATGIVLSGADAQRAGFDVTRLQYFGRANTANGEVRTAPVRLDEINLGGIRDRNVPAFVNEGQMDNSLLGMTYLQLWDRIEIADGKLILTR